VADRIRVLTVDSRSATMGQGLIVLDVAELAASGATPEELVAQAESVIPRTSVFGAVNSLEHLEKGGRIGGAKAMLGTLLSIKPVITVVNGIVEEESKQRTRSRSLRYLADKAQAAGPLSRIAVCNGAATDIDELLGLLDGVKSEHPLMVADLGPVIGTHTGPGTVGLCMITTG
jgi:DegV family protein with EDD domain